MEASENTVRLSYSSLASYRSCPHRYKNEPRQAGNEASEKGKIFHDAMQKILTGEDKAEVRAWLGKTMVEWGFSPDSLAEVHEMFDRVSSSKFYIPEPGRIISVESDDGEIMLHGAPAFAIPLPIVVDGKRVVLSGRFDLVLSDEQSGGIEIRDWKTGFLDADELQRDIYALAAYLKYWKISPIKIRFVYTRRSFSPRPTVYNASDMPAILEYIAILSTSLIRDTEFKPKLNANCKNCSLRMSCPEFVDAISKAPAALTISPDNWSAIRKWKEHLGNVAKATAGLLDDMKKLEEDYLERNKTAVEDNGSIVEMSQQVGAYEYPVKQVSALLEEAGVDWTGAIKMTTAGLESTVESAVVEGKITEVQADEIWRKINGEKAKKSDVWEIEPIRQIAYYKKTIRKAKPAEEQK